VVINSSNLAAAYWLSGEFGRAYETIGEALALSREPDTSLASAWALAYHAWLDAAAGKYAEARTHARSALASTRKGGIWLFALLTGLLGWVALAEERYAEAKNQLQQSLAACKAHADREYEAWSLAALAGAEYGLGNRAAAQGHLLEALEIVVEIRAFIPLLHLMPIIPVVLAGEDEPNRKTRAVELYALAASHPFVAKARLFEDIAGRHVKAAAACLPPDVARAAELRGQALDWWDTAGELLGELRDMGWSR
jgi:tetratricopeptide (TPR) repeat protein